METMKTGLPEASPHSTKCIQLAANEWRLALEGIGWFRAAPAEQVLLSCKRSTLSTTSCMLC